MRLFISLYQGKLKGPGTLVSPVVLKALFHNKAG
jgi:hypothetical protein